MEGETPRNSLFKKKITIGGSSVSRTQANSTLIKRLTRHGSSDIPLTSRRIVNEKIKNMDNYNSAGARQLPQSRGAMSSGSQTHRLFNPNYQDNVDFYLPNVKTTVIKKGMITYHNKNENNNLQNTHQNKKSSNPSQQELVSESSKSISPPHINLAAFQTQRVPSSRSSIRQPDNFPGLSRQSSFAKMIIQPTNGFLAGSISERNISGDMPQKKFNFQQDELNILRKSQQFAQNLLKPRLNGGINQQDSLINSNLISMTGRIPQLKTYTPKTTKQIKTDRNHIIHMKEKSFAKLFEPTTFIQEDDPSFEDELEGEEAKGMFYKKGKNLERMIQKRKESPFTKFFQNCYINHVIPQPIGIVNSKGYKRTTVQTAGFKMGDDYAQALGESLRKTTRHPVVVNLSVNRLSDKGAVPILNSLSNDIQELDLSSNPLMRIKSYVLINDLLSKGLNKLKTLKLEKNNIGDHTMKQLCETLEGNSTLTFLNVNNNNITDQGASYLANMLRVNSALRVLFINWNKIRFRGAVLLADALAVNKGVQILDASFNSFGSNQQAKQSYLQLLTPKTSSQNGEQSPETPEKFKASQINGGDAEKLPQSFKNMFLSNKTLIHVDLSHNGFMEDEIKGMSEGLKENHTILGLHMLGNQRSTDTLGYVTLRDNNPGASHIMTKLSSTLDMGRVPQNKHQLQSSSNCWICEGWTQIMFQFDPMKTIHKKLDEYSPVYIHLSCDNFQPDLMERNEDGVYRLLRMIPPGQQSYYFTIDSETDNQYYAHDQKHREVYMGEKIDYRTMKVPITNIIENVAQQRQPITQTLLEDLSVMIRPPPREPPQRNKEKEPWDFKKSVFYPYQPDSEALLNSCFDFDFETSKITKVIKDYEEIPKIKEYLRTIYKYVRECYKYFSAISPNNNVFSVGQLIFQEIINNMTVIDRELLSNNDVDLEFITTNAGVKQHKFNPDRALVRYQMLELFVRLAVQKFYKSKICDTYFEAIQTIFEKEIMPYIKNFDCHIWRKNCLWTESCDIIFKAYMPVVKMLYKQNSGRYTKPGHQPFMSLEEFQEMITQTSICSDNFGQREIGIHFNLSKMTEVNEVDFDKHMKMQFIEFIEALGRIAEKLNLDTLKSKYGFDDDDDQDNKEYNKANNNKLSSKIEFLIKILMGTNLNSVGNDKKLRQLNKQIENNIQKNKSSTMNVLESTMKKKVSMMSILINNFQNKGQQQNANNESQLNKVTENDSD